MKRRPGSRISRSVVVLLVLGLTAAVGAAQSDHLVWLQPEQFTATPGAILSIAYRRGAEFGPQGGSIAADDLESVRAELSGSPMSALAFNRPGADPKLWVTMARVGHALVDVRLLPQRRTVAAVDVPRYLRALHAPDEVLELWAKQPPGAKWAETRRFSLKTALKAGQSAENDRTWASARRAGWEIVATTNPLELRQNDRFRVQILEEGQPVAGVLVDFVSDQERIQHVVATDKDGFAEAELADAGLWLVHASDIKRVDAETMEWVVDYAAFTLQVQPR